MTRRERLRATPLGWAVDGPPASFFEINGTDDTGNSDCFTTTLECLAWHEGEWIPLAVIGNVGRNTFRHEELGLDLEFELEIRDEGYGFCVSYTSRHPTRMLIRLVLRNVRQAFHVIPGCIFGDNNLAHTEPEHFMHLTSGERDEASCSSHWEFRADRAAMPVSMIAFEGGVAGLFIQPYSDDVEGVQHHLHYSKGEGFLRNGLYCEWSERGAGCGVTVGYRNDPMSFYDKRLWGVSTENLAARVNRVRGRIFLQPSEGREGIHAIMETLYRELHHPPESELDCDGAVHALGEQLTRTGWDQDKRMFGNVVMPPAKDPMPPMAIEEISWTGGGSVAFPLLKAGLVLNKTEWVKKASLEFDRIAASFNRDSGLLWDAPGHCDGKPDSVGWWQEYLPEARHCAYTNGSAVSYLLAAYTLLQESGIEQPLWKDTGLRVLDTIYSLQKEDGNYGWAYSIHQPEILDDQGFAGAWFISAMIYGYQLTGDSRYLDSARMAARYYHGFVRKLEVWGTPMDTFKANDQEGNLGFMRGVALLHQVTQDPVYITMLEDSAHYEYLWRYAYKARPECPPLRGSNWNSCGGSITSVSNPHMHPMGLIITSELRYLAKITQRELHAKRAQDGVDWALQTVALYPEVTGCGTLGMLTERYCPSDGLLIEKYPDQSPASIWFFHNAWAAGTVLEGLIGEWVPCHT